MAGGNIERNMYKLKKELGGDGDFDDREDDGNDATLSDKVGYSVQAHHCISCSIIAEDEFETVADAAIEAGYDINGAGNGIALPAYFGHMRREHKQRHRGGHDAIYYNKVRQKLRPLIRKLEGCDACGEDKDKVLKALAGVESALKSGLLDRSIWLYDWSKNLWSKDYRDEGAGELKSSRAREGSYSSGVEWAGKYKRGSLRRRYEVVYTPKGKPRQVVRQSFYDKWQYPVPGKPTS